VTEYLEGLPSAQRSPASLYQAVDDPVQFRRQVTALYWHTLLTLSGFELAETPGQAKATSTVNANVAAAPTEAKDAQA
jgi:hypothetical protein